MNILQNALNNKIREEEEKKKKGQGALSSVYGQNTAGMGGASGGGLLSMEKNAAGQSANTGAGGTGIGHQMFVDSLRRNQNQQAAGGRNAISPFGVAHLDEKYQQTVRDLYNAGGSNKNGLNPLEDAYNIVNDYSNTVRASFELNKNAPEGKNPVQIGENAYQEAMKKALTRYQYNGASAEDMRSGLESMHYMSPKAQEEANRQSVIDYAAQFMPAKAQPETQNMAGLYRNVNGILDKFADGQNGNDLSVQELEVLYEAQDAGLISENETEYATLSPEQKTALAAWGEKQAREIGPNAPTYEEADAWMTQNKPLYALAKENKGDIQGLQSTYRNVNGILDKFANGQHGNDLSARELEVLYAAQDAGLIGTNETEYAKLSPEQKTALAAWGGSQAQEIGQYGKMVTVSKPSAAQDTLLAMYHDTLDGAKAWAEEAKGTEDEQPAKDNLWFIEKRTKFEDEKTNGDIERYGQADAGFRSGNAQLDSAYAIINDIDNAAGTEVLSLLASNHGNEDALNFHAQLTDEEKATFNALANSGKYEDALEYLDYKRYEVRERAQNEAAELVYKATNEHGALGAVAGSALSVPLSVFRGVGTADIALQNFRNAISGDYRPVDYNTQAQMLGRAADSMRQGVMDQVNWSVNILGRDTDLFDFIYGTGMSGLDSAAAGALGGWTGAALLGAGAAQSAMQELHDAGGNDRQVVLGGMLAGAFETLFEHISIDKFYNEAKHLGKRTFKDAMSNVLAQAGINFSEEFNTELADVISEKLIMGDKWDMNRQRDEYMRLGMTEQEANNRMAEDITYRLLEAGLGGALMGAGFGAVSNVSSNTATSKLDKKTGNYFSGDARNTLKSLGESMTGEARDQAARYDAAKASDKETGALYRTIVQGLPAEFRGTIRETMALDALNNMQANGPADMQAAGALMALLEGQNLDAEQLTALARSEGGMQAVYDIMGIENMGRALAGNPQSQTKTQEEAADAGAEMPEELERGLKAPQTLGERMNVREEAETQAHAQPQQQRQALGERMNVREDAETRAPAAEQQPGQPQQRQALGERMTAREEAETRAPAAEQARELQELGERMRTIAQQMTARESTETQAPADQAQATEQRAQAEEQARELQELGERMRTIAQQMTAQESTETQAPADQAQATEQRSPEAEQARELQELGERMRTIAQQMTARENAETQAPAEGHARELQALGERMRTIAQSMAAQENTEAQETIQPKQPQTLGERMYVREDAETRAPAAEQQPGQPQQQTLGERMNVREDAETRAPAAEQQPGQPLQRQALGERMNVREERTVNLEGRGVNLTTYGTESARPAAQIEKSGDGLAVRFEDGSAASLSALNVTDGEGAVLGRASFMEDQDAALDMIEAYDGNKDFDTGDNYAVSYQQVYEKAAKGQPADSVKSIFRDNLTDDQAQSALRAGQREYLRREAMAQAANERAAKEAGFAALEKNTGDKAGVFFARVDSGMKGKDGEIDRKKAATFRVLDLYAQEKGLQIRVFDNLDVENGSYVQGENVINLALNAEESAYTHTVSHEIFHYLRQFAPEAAENIKRFVVDTLKAVAGYDYDQRIRDVQEKYRTAKGEELTDAQAEDEITADSLVDVIGTEENVNKLVRTQGVSITEKISQWIKSSVQAFRNILNRLTGKSPEVAALKENADYLERVRGMVDSALDTAKENYREARSTITEAALRDADVQAYEAGMETASTEAAAEEERNALASNLFVRYYEKAARMLEGIDYEDAYNKFVSALKSFGSKDTQDLATAMKRQGLPAQSADMNPALSYAARQLAAGERKSQIRHTVSDQRRDISYVQADRQVIEGEDPQQWGRQVTDYINETIRSGKDVTVFSENGVPLKITQDTAGKAAFWNVHDDRTAYTPEEYALKLRIESHIDEALQVSKGTGRKRPDTKNHPFARDGFNYRSAYFMDFDGRYYSFEISVGQNGKNNTAYNVNRINEAALPQALRGSPRLKAVGGNTASGSIVAQEGSGVNTQFSLREDTGAQQAERAAESVRGDAELYAQARTDEDLNAAIQLLDTLHYQTTQGGADAPIQRGAFEKRLGDIADKYIEQTGTKYGRVKLMGELRKIYQAMEQKEYSPGEVLTYARQLMRDVLDKSPGMLVELDDSTKEALRVLKRNSFFLTDGQKSEIRGTYGSVADYRRKNFGKLRIASQKNAKVSLAEVWRESLTPLNPGTFAEDANEADMPGILDAFLERASEKRYDGSIGDVVGLSTDFALKAMLDFYDVPGALQGKENIRDDFRAKAEKWRTGYQDKYQQRIQKSQERKEKTIRKQKLRARITADVRRLNALAVTNSDNKHVPTDMRAAVLAAVKPFLEAETGVFSQAEMQRLSNEYAILQQRSGEIRGFDEDILATIQDLGNRLNGRRLSKLTEQELSDLSDVVGNIRHMVAEANEAVVNGRKTTVDELSAELKNDMRSKGQAKDGKFAEKVRKLNYKETTPTYYAERVGGVIRDMVRDLFDGQNKWAFAMNAAKEFLGDDSRHKKTGVFGKYHVNDWINDKETLRIVTQAGDQIELNRQEALSLYALWKRETTNKIQNANHLRIGGFMYDKGAKYEGVDTLKPHAIADADMEKVKNYLGKEQMDFADEMVKYLTETLGAVGNEVSRRLYGYEKFKEKNYFPYETDRRFLAGDLTQTGEPVKQPKNAGMTKATLRNAATPITVHNFMDVWAGHVNQMALYQAFAETIDTMNRVLNARAAGEIHTDSLTGLDHVTAPESNWVEMERALGAEGVQYLKTLVRDVSGGVRADERGIMAKGLSAFKKASVAGNLSVVLQQPTAYARALMMVNPRYLLASNPAKLSKNIKNMYQYSGVALIKNMGKFDTGTGKGAVQWLTDGVREASAGKRVLDSIDTVTGIGAEKADEWTWGLLWGAIENETKHTRADLTDGTEDFYRAVAQRFEDVVNHTQVYDSVLSRSEWMRGTSTMDKMATSFMAEPTLSLNMLMDTIVRFREDGQGGRKVARAAATFLVTTMLTSLAKSIITATRRKDDEGRTWLEKYLAEAAGNFVDDVNPFGLAGMIPWARDAVSIFEGYDIERSDMDAVTKLYKAYQTVTNDNKSMEDKLQETCGAVGYLFGVPVKNVWRDTEAVIRNLFGGGSAEGPSTARDIKYSVLDSVGKIGPFTLWDSKNAAYYERMEQALIAGDEDKFRELRDYMEDTNQIDGKAVISEVKKAVKQSVQRGLISDEKATELLEKYLGADAGKGWKTVEQWKQTAAHAEDEEYSYSKYGELLSAVKAGKGVQEEKAKLISHGEEEKELQSKIKTAVGEWYRNGEIDRKTAEKTLREQVPTLDSNALYWQLDKWDHEKINGESAAYNKYGAYIQAVRTGKDLRAETRRYLDHGVDKDTLARQITSAFKSEYINLYKTNRSAALSLRGYLANAYAALGYDREKKLKDIDRWLKDVK